MLLNFANTILILFLLSGSHNHYTSITNANLNTQNGKIEISVELTAHDLENYFISEQKVNLKLGSSKEFPNANELIESYINYNLIFKINNKSTALTLIGKEVATSLLKWMKPVVKQVMLKAKKLLKKDLTPYETQELLVFEGEKKLMKRLKKEQKQEKLRQLSVHQAPPRQRIQMRMEKMDENKSQP